MRGPKSLEIEPPNPTKMVGFTSWMLNFFNLPLLETRKGLNSEKTWKIAPVESAMTACINGKMYFGKKCFMKKYMRLAVLIEITVYD